MLWAGRALVVGAAGAWAQLVADEAAAIVLTERHRFGRAAAKPGTPLEATLDQALAALLAALSRPASPLLELLAFQDCCRLAERGGPHGKSWLKSVVLGRDDGAEWGRVAAAALRPLQDLTAGLRACLAPLDALDDRQKPDFKRNGLHRAGSRADGDRRAWRQARAFLEAQHQKVAWAARTLAALVAAGVQYNGPLLRDREPRLPVVLLELAACLHALQQYMRSWGTMSILDKGFRTLAQSLRSRLVEKGAGGELAQPDLSSVVWALEDTLKLVVYTLVDAAAADLGFDQKQRLAAALAQSAQDGVFTQLPGLFPQVFVEAPPYGRREDLAVLIACVLKNEL